MRKCLLCHVAFDGFKNVCETCYVEKVLPLKKTRLTRKPYVEPLDW